MLPNETKDAARVSDSSPTVSYALLGVTGYLHLDAPEGMFGRPLGSLEGAKRYSSISAALRDLQEAAVVRGRVAVAAARIVRITSKTTVVETTEVVA